MPTSRHFIASAALVTFAASLALAQPAQPAAPRKPTVNIKGQAGQPRPGQVVAGQPAPAPAQPAQPAAPSAPAAPAQPAQPTPPTQPAAPAQPGAPAAPATPIVITTAPATTSTATPTPAAAAAPSATPPATPPTVYVPPAPPPAPTYFGTDASSGSLYIPAPQDAPSANPQAAIAPEPVYRDVPPGPGTDAPHIFKVGPTPNDTLASLRSIVRDVPVLATVQSVSGSAEWRTGDGAWSPLSTGATADGILEVRTGVAGDATLMIADNVRVTIDRLSLATIKRLRVGENTPEAPAPERMVVNLQRGRVTVDPGAPMPDGARRLVTITTPDGILVVSEATEVTSDAGKATTHRAVPASR